MGLQLRPFEPAVGISCGLTSVIARGATGGAKGRDQSRKHCPDAALANSGQKMISGEKALLTQAVEQFLL